MPSPKSSKRSKPEQKALDWDPLGLMAGVDEAGRGPLAGPVVAAAVILDDSKRIRGLADSKVLTPLQRDRLFDQIREKALCCAVGEASVAEIDEINIFHATMLAMKRAVEGLRLKPAKVLVDGNRLPRIDVLCEAIVGGDAKVRSISAASIVAKVTRDRILAQLHEEFPQYGFAAHKGYSTPEHLEALRTHGPCIHHRRHFAPVAATFVTEEGTAVSVTVQ
jgi:ribonuclease HII